MTDLAPAARRRTLAPNPTEVENEAIDVEDEENRFAVAPDPDKPTIALAFKLEDGKYGWGGHTFVRYEGNPKNI